MRLFIVCLFCLPLISNGQTQMMDKAFQLFDGNGELSSTKALMEATAQADIVFFGELHNNPISHWLQLELTKNLFAVKDGKIMLGAEMFESDNQILIDEYFKGYISQKNFEEEARLWNNYKTDYKPLLEFAKAHQINFIATNIPRRYASLVFKGGFEALNELSDMGKGFVAPIPVPYDPELPGYKKMLEMMGGSSDHGGDNFPKAQAIKDATMGHFIVKNYQEGDTFIHFNGSYHSNNKEGIVWYINEYLPGKKIVTITTIEADNLDELAEDQKNTADFIIVVPSSMTKTY